MSTDIIKIVLEAVIGIVAVLITSCLIPWLKSKLGDDKFARLSELVSLAVRTAEQIYTVDEWKEKKAYVLAYAVSKAKELGLELTDEDIENLIEGLVNAIKKGNKYAIS